MGPGTPDTKKGKRNVDYDNATLDISLSGLRYGGWGVVGETCLWDVDLHWVIPFYIVPEDRLYCINNNNDNNCRL